MKAVTVKLDDGLFVRTARVAKIRRTTTSAVIREALERHLSDETDPLADIRDLIGSVEGGPPDLSTNAKYLRGDGEAQKRADHR